VYGLVFRVPFRLHEPEPELTEEKRGKKKDKRDSKHLPQ
jgi:hypothetical protein